MIHVNVFVRDRKKGTNSLVHKIRAALGGRSLKVEAFRQAMKAGDGGRPYRSLEPKSRVYVTDLYATPILNDRAVKRI